jgi:hypothetical protein
VTVEDRLRATTEAVTLAMRPVRPLSLPPAPAQFDRGPRRRRVRRLPGWLIPVAAAAAVIIVAATLVAVRNLSGSPAPRPASRSTPTATSTARPSPGSAGIPRYYVTLSPQTENPVQDAIVGDDRTGQKLATLTPPAGATFASLAAAPDDRTFVLDAMTFWTKLDSPPAHTWYVLRIAPGTSHPATLTRLPIAASMSATEIVGLAISPDGRTLAILYQPDVIDVSSKTPPGRITLRTYSMATGRVLRTWTEPSATPANATTLYDDNTDGLTWLADGDTLAFVYPSFAARRAYRTLDVSAPGDNLVTESHAVFTLPAGGHACLTQLIAPGGGTVLCGTFAARPGSCGAAQPEFDAYSTATGKLAGVLYRHQGSCPGGAFALLAWAGSGTTAIGVMSTIKSGNVAVFPPTTDLVGVLANGTLSPLRVIVSGTGYGQGTMAF